MTAADLEAEAVVAACCVDNPHAVALAHARLQADDFADLTLRQLFAISPQLPTDVPDHLADPWQPMLHELRLAAAASRCGLTTYDLQALFAGRTVMADTAGTYANRVRTAGLRRRALAALDTLRAEIADGAPLDRLAELGLA